jgi:hypothetical protein
MYFCKKTTKPTLNCSLKKCHMIKMYSVFLLFILIVNPCFSENKVNLNTNNSPSNTKENVENLPLNLLFEKGSNAYAKYEYDQAIQLWKKVLEKAEKLKDSNFIIKSNINIGASYNALGFHKTALNYFLKTEALFKNYKLQEAPYWINHLNIGVCYMSLDQFKNSEKYFETTKNFDNYIVFLKKLNLAKWFALQDQQEKFISFQSDIEKRIIEFPMYYEIWNEMQLDFLIKWKNTNKIKKALERLKPEYDQQNIHLKLLLNSGNLLVYNQTIESESKLLSYNELIIDSNDMYLKDLYYSLLKLFYYTSNNITKYHFFSELCNQNEAALNKEKNMLYVEDFKAAKELDEIKLKYKEEKLKNELIQNKLSKSELKLLFSLVIIVMGIGIIFLVIRNYKKNKKINALSLIQSQNELNKKEFEKVVLTENLKEKADELTVSILNIKKVALLKKQLEKIIDEKNPNQDEKDILKQLKVCLNSFFDNYRDLNLLMQKKLNVDKIVRLISKEFPEISSKETEVIEYIMLQFTTKEIAVLMDKSEKSIEYYRSQIRKKFQLQPNNTLEQYLNSRVKDSDL